jgi:hypothetical protein
MVELLDHNTMPHFLSATPPPVHNGRLLTASNRCSRVSTISSANEDSAFLAVQLCRFRSLRDGHDNRNGKGPFALLLIFSFSWNQRGLAHELHAFCKKGMSR